MTRWTATDIFGVTMSNARLQYSSEIYYAIGYLMGLRDKTPDRSLDIALLEEVVREVQSKFPQLGRHIAVWITEEALLNAYFRPVSLE